MLSNKLQRLPWSISQVPNFGKILWLESGRLSTLWHRRWGGSHNFSKSCCVLRSFIFFSFAKKWSSLRRRLKRSPLPLTQKIVFFFFFKLERSCLARSPSFSNEVLGSNPGPTLFFSGRWATSTVRSSSCAAARSSKSLRSKPSAPRPGRSSSKSPTSRGSIRRSRWGPLLLKKLTLEPERARFFNAT